MSNIFKFRARFLAISAVLLFASQTKGEVLTIDLTHEVRPAAPVELGQGTNVNPQGQKLTADSVSLFLDDKPFIPVAGEFHFSRYPREEWRDELLKMKAGGINVVSTYVFWIHHEEEQGKFDWSDRRDLRAFVLLCGELGLKVIVRMGPWDHGEVRNGGFPDWVQKSGVKLRSTDPAFIKLVEPFYAQIFEQIKRLLWKDGGPVIAVQHDNECDNLPYLLELKKLAKSIGVDVPFYIMTGWNRVSIPPSELLPLFGAYSVSFWTAPGNTNYKKSFVFTKVRDDGDLGAQFVNMRPGRSVNIERYPYLCCEIGGGMPSSYAHRVKVEPDEIAAMALVRLGCGNNMPGYYMYQGGINPEAKFSYLNEERPNLMPFKDYDFQAPLGALGQVRKHYHLLREQHLFVEDFGATLARMGPFLPDKQPENLDDVATLRWSARTDGNAGYVFFNNYQPLTSLPEKQNTQFGLKTKSGDLVFPAQPINIPSGSYGIFPFNLDCDGALLQYATAQPLCRLKDENAAWYFFAQADGIQPEMAFKLGRDAQISTPNTKLTEKFDDLHVLQIIPSLNQAVSIKLADGKTVNFVVLTPEQSRSLYRVTFAGRERLILAKAALLPDLAGLRVQAPAGADMSLAIFPAVGVLHCAGADITGKPSGIFEQFTPAVAEAKELAVSMKKTKVAGPVAATLKSMDDTTWDAAEEWVFDIPKSAADPKSILSIHYVGDAARLYCGDKFILDNFYNGDPMELGLWRIPLDQLSQLRLKVLPHSEALMKRLPPAVAEVLAKPESVAKIGAVSATTTPQIEITLNAPK